MSKIQCSATILTFNSAKTLRKTLESVRDFEDIVILDGGSTDETLNIARELGARIFPQKESGESGKIQNFTEVRKKSFELAKYDWVFYVDSDEYLSKELKQDIHEAVQENNVYKVYYFNRIAVVENKIIKHCFLYPEYTLRLVNIKSGIYWKEGPIVHESLIVSEEAQKIYLESPLYAIWPPYQEAIAKDNFYLSLVEKKFTEQAKDFSWFKFFRSIIINKLKAFSILYKILKTYIKYGTTETMPLKYQLRFVRYHLLMAFSKNKFKLMLVNHSLKHENMKT